MEQRITVNDILDKHFSKVPVGYDPQEVDEYLDLICDELDRKDAEIEELNKRLALAAAQQPDNQPRAVEPEPVNADGAFREILEMAKRVKDQTIADAQKTADEIKTRAEEEAAAQLSELQGKKDQLESAYESLKVETRGYYDLAHGILERLEELLK